jgi:hypothetical protein
LSVGPYCAVCDATWSESVCVVCGQHFLADIVRHRGGHDFDPAAEGKIEAGRKRQSGLGRKQPRSLRERLRDGFEMLDDERV